MDKQFWIKVTDPKELRERADDLEKEGLLRAAQEFRERAAMLERGPLAAQ